MDNNSILEDNKTNDESIANVDVNSESNEYEMSKESISVDVNDSVGSNIEINQISDVQRISGGELEERIESDNEDDILRTISDGTPENISQVSHIVDINDKNHENLDASDPQNDVANNGTETDDKDEFSELDSMSLDNNANEEIIEDEVENTAADDEDGVAKNDTPAENNDSNFKMSDELLEDLEVINDDFKSEIEAEKAKILEEAKKNAGVEDEEEKELDLKPLKSEGKLEDIENLSLDNIEEFLKNNGKAYCDLINNKDDTLNEGEKVKGKNAEDSDGNVESDMNGDVKDEFFLQKENMSLLKNFTLNEDLWSELNLDPELNEKILTRVKLEIRSFIKGTLMPFLQGVIR